MTSELEKIQLETARLQMEQEKHKLAQMQRRQKVVGELGSGAVAAGGAAVRASKSVGQLALGLIAISLTALMGAAIGVAVVTLLTQGHLGGLCPAYPSAEFLYRLGCFWGTNPWAVFAGAVVGAATLLVAVFSKPHTR